MLLARCLRRVGDENDSFSLFVSGLAGHGVNDKLSRLALLVGLTPPVALRVSPNRPVEWVHDTGVPCFLFAANAAGIVSTESEGDPLFSAVCLG
jgi:hypothetical protein